MKWPEIRQHYQDQWLLIEAIKARSQAGPADLGRHRRPRHLPGFGGGHEELRQPSPRGAAAPALYLPYRPRRASDPRTPVAGDSLCLRSGFVMTRL